MGFIKQNFLGGAEEDASKAQQRAAGEGIRTVTEAGRVASDRFDSAVQLGQDAAAGTGGGGGGILDDIRNEDNLTFERGQGFDQINKAFAAGSKGLTSGQRGLDLVEFDRGLRTRNNNNRVNQLLQLIQGGQAGATAQANVGLRTGENVSDLQVGRGDAKAAGIIGKKNAVGSTIGQVAKAVSGHSFFDAFRQPK
jgi:hypothetical protein